jgi:hypothetical protein
MSNRHRTACPSCALRPNHDLDRLTNQWLEFCEGKRLGLQPVVRIVQLSHPGFAGLVGSPFLHGPVAQAMSARTAHCWESWKARCAWQVGAIPSSATRASRRIAGPRPPVRPPRIPQRLGSVVGRVYRMRWSYLIWMVLPVYDAAWADSWPQFRGPGGSGRAESAPSLERRLTGRKRRSPRRIVPQRKTEPVRRPVGT